MKLFRDRLPDIARLARKVVVNNFCRISVSLRLVPHRRERVLIRNEKYVGHSVEIFLLLRRLYECDMRRNGDSIRLENRLRIGDSRRIENGRGGGNEREA